MIKNRNTSLYSWKHTFDLEDLRKISNCITFVQEQVLIPHQLLIVENDSSTESFIFQRINELREIGAIATWSIEGATKESSFSGETDVSVSGDDYLSIYKHVNERLLNLREVRVGMNRFNHDGISEVVQGKHSIIHQELAAYFGCISTLNDSISDYRLRSFDQSLGSLVELTAMIAEVLPQNIGLPDITLLPIEKIEEARLNLEKFRSYIATKAMTLSTIASSSLDEARDVIVEQIAQEYSNAKKRKVGVIDRSIFFLSRHTNLLSASHSDPMSLLIGFSKP